MAIALQNFAYQYPKRNKKVEEAGIFYEVCLIRDALLLGLSLDYPVPFDDDDELTDSAAASIRRVNDALGIDYSKTIDEWIDPEGTEYMTYIKSLDPKDWKSQDHYKVLGIQSLRYKAADEQIKLAYRQKVLLHHPDKRSAAKEGEALDEEYFSCITKAYEQLSSPARRISYDSVDYTFNEAIPSANKDYPKDVFFKVFRPVFERNARFSRITPVPPLGDESTSMEEVGAFYSFWFDFDSWREFSYLDEEDKEKGQDRDERRWIEKENRVKRQRLRKEEVKRVRRLVETAYAADPRVLEHKDAERRRREEYKAARVEADRKRKEDELAKRAEQEASERRLAEERAEAERQAAQVAKKEREVKKKHLQKERKRLMELFKKHNYFTPPSDEPLHLTIMTSLDKFLTLADAGRMKDLHTLLTAPSTANEGEAGDTSDDRKREVFQQFVTAFESTLQKATHQAAASSQPSSAKEEALAAWTEEERLALVKAVTLFPVGTKARWGVIAEFVNEKCSSSPPKHSKDVIAKVKELQKLDEAAKFEGTSSNPLSVKMHSNAQVESAPSERTEGLPGRSESPWSNEEQKLLEQALRTYPASTPDRWDRIAEVIPEKTKRDCVLRYKELAELVRLKKIAQEKANLKCDLSGAGGAVNRRKL